MRQADLTIAHVFRATCLGVAIGSACLTVPVSAQQPSAAPTAAALPSPPAAALATPSPVQPPAAQPNQATAGMLPPSAVPPTPAPGIAATQAAGTAPAPNGASAGATAAVGTAPAPKPAADDVNPFSSVKPVDNQALKQELPAIEQRLRQMESQMSAIQQVQVAMPADALNGPGGARAPGAAGNPADAQANELEAATFVACVNGQAMFRDTDQKPFFVNAKEANQNEAVHRIGGCKH